MRLAILGVTGSIGKSALSLLSSHPGLAEVVLLSAHTNAEALLEQIELFKPSLACLTGRLPTRPEILRAEAVGCKLEGLPEGLHEQLEKAELDCVLLAMTGAAGLSFGLQALKLGLRLAIANKEPLVIAGHLFHQAAKEGGGEILPVDSEHSAIFQCLQSRPTGEIEKIILTSSGGPFHEWSREQMASASVADALKHPTWSMGRKITIDSASMLNKALEVLEARWLFHIPMQKVQVVVHRQSVVHSMVEFVDGSVIAQLGETDMRHPILYAFSHPHRYPSNLGRLDFSSRLDLSFEQLNPVLARAIDLARSCGERADRPIILNAANEIYVERFLEAKLPFLQIHDFIEKLMDEGTEWNAPTATLEDVLTLDRLVRKEATRRLDQN